MKLDAQMFAGILSLLTSIGWGGKYVYEEGKGTGKAVATVEFQKEHEDILNTNLRYKFVCKCE